MNGINEVLLGLRYLIRYSENKVPSYLEVIKNYKDDIKLWAILMSFCNNMDEMFDLIPDKLLESHFKNVVGYKSNYEGDCHNEIKMLRNCIAHSRYSINGNNLTVKYRDFTAEFDRDWFFKMYIECVGSDSNYLKASSSDIFLSLLETFHEDDDKSLVEFFQNGEALFFQLTLKDDNPEHFIETFNIKYAKAEDINFAKYMRFFSDILLSLMTKVKARSKSEINKCLEIINKKYGHLVKIERVEPSLEMLKDPEFAELDFESASQIMVDYLRNDKNSANTLNMYHLFEVLESIDDLTPAHEYVLKLLHDYLIKLYSYIAICGLNIYNNLGRRDFELIESFQDKMSIGFGHDRKVYEEYIKRIEKSITALQQGKAHPKYINTYYNLLVDYKGKSASLNGFVSWSQLIYNLRSSLTHNLVEFNEGRINLYRTAPRITLWHYSKKSGELTSKAFQKKERIFDFSMDMNDLLDLLDQLLGIRGIETKVNISKFVRRNPSK